MGLWYALIWNPPFRAVFYYRMCENERKKIWKIISKIQLLLLPNVKQVEISGKIDKGFVVFHGQGTIIHCNAAGENLAVWQNVTVGRNPSHIKNGSDKPILGNNVNIYTGSIVAGGIVIGDNVDIGAGSVVLKDVPSNCVVAGNPAKIIKRKF